MSIVLMYINPIQNCVEVMLSCNETPVILEVLNLKGQVLKSISASSSKETIDTKELPKGYYLLSIKTGKKVEYKKLKL